MSAGLQAVDVTIYGPRTMRAAAVEAEQAPDVVDILCACVLGCHACASENLMAGIVSTTNTHVTQAAHEALPYL